MAKNIKSLSDEKHKLKLFALISSLYLSVIITLYFLYQHDVWLRILVIATVVLFFLLLMLFRRVKGEEIINVKDKRLEYRILLENVYKNNNTKYRSRSLIKVVSDYNVDPYLLIYSFLLLIKKIEKKRVLNTKEDLFSNTGIRIWVYAIKINPFFKKIKKEDWDKEFKSALSDVYSYFPTSFKRHQVNFLKDSFL